MATNMQIKEKAAIFAFLGIFLKFFLRIPRFLRTKRSAKKTEIQNQTAEKLKNIPKKVPGEAMFSATKYAFDKSARIIKISENISGLYLKKRNRKTG